MNIMLADNIRAFRKTRGLTQEQLAEALGVTVGAVYKWEAKLSTPDINLIIELADLFDTSVDVLLGYEIKDNKQKATVARLKQLLHERDERAIAEAEKALTRYPNCFDVVYQSATLFHMFGLIKRDKGMLQRAIGLMERSILLIGQNTDPKQSALSIYTEMANVYFGLGEAEKAVALLKANNPCGINDALIGQTLASLCNMPEEAMPHLSAAFLNCIASFTHIVVGYCNVYFKKRAFADAVLILRAVLAMFEQLKYPGQSGFLDRVNALFYTLLASAQAELGETDGARSSLRAAQAAAETFDRMPDYRGNSIRFVTEDATTVFDDLGDTAQDAILNLMKDIGSGALDALWAEICHEG